MKHLNPILIFAAVFTASSQQGHAQDLFETDGWVIGGTVAYQSTILEKGDDFLLPLPFFNYKQGRLEVGMDGIKYDLLTSERFNISAIGDIRDMSLSADDIDEEYASIKRGVAFEAGFSSALDLGAVTLGAKVFRDVSGEHEGLGANLRVSTTTTIGASTFSASVGRAYQDKKLSLHKYGIKQGEATNTLSAYTPDANWNTFAKASIARRLTDRTAIVGEVSYTKIADEIADSPLVNKDNSKAASVSLVRSF